MLGTVHNATPSFAKDINETKPVTLKNAYKSMFRVTTYSADGKKIGEGTGFFISASGEGLAQYSLFRGAAKAEVVDYKGKLLSVSRILGASELYDLVKFSTQGGKKIQPMPFVQSDDLKSESNVNLVRFTTNKKKLPVPAKVEKVDDFDNYKYYTLSIANDTMNVACPILTEEGYVAAFTQFNVGGDSLGVCAIDVRFAKELSINSTSAFNSDLTAIKIPKALPEKEEDAETFVYMASRMDSVTAHTALNDFLTIYPENVEGYVNRASFFVRYNNFEKAEDDYATALQKSVLSNSNYKKDEVYNAMSKQIYQKVVTNSASLPDNWTLQRALEEAENAYKTRPLRYYLLQQGHCLFAQKQYAKAYEKYLGVCLNEASDTTQWSLQSEKETWYYATRAFELSGGDSTKVVALMDSVIAHLPRPVEMSDAIYYLERANRLERVGEYRKAVLDYNEYENIVGNNNLSDTFYYLREQLEMKCGMYQQALDDINTAISRNPLHPDYPVEHAYILLRAAQYEDAAAVCTEQIRTVKDNPDYYKILGIALGELGQTKKALEQLKKAESLGDPTVDTFIQKYSKAKK
jgi:tetratricopeptide (TPR) repeat protein